MQGALLENSGKEARTTMAPGDSLSPLGCGLAKSPGCPLVGVRSLQADTVTGCFKAGLVPGQPLLWRSQDFAELSGKGPEEFPPSAGGCGMLCPLLHLCIFSLNWQLEAGDLESIPKPDPGGLG